MTSGFQESKFPYFRPKLKILEVRTKSNEKRGHFHVFLTYHTLHKITSMNVPGTKMQTLSHPIL